MDSRYCSVDSRCRYISVSTDRLLEGGEADDCPGPGLPHHVPEGLQRVAARVLRHDELPVAPAIELSDDISRMLSPLHL